MDDKTKLLDLMNIRIQYHEKEIARIKACIIAYQNCDDPNPKQRRTTKWTAEIEKIVLPGRAFSIEQIKHALISNGIGKANTQQGRSSITTTLGRMIKNKKIVETVKGFYRSNKGENKNE